MRSYWMRILLGALAIFCIGMIGVTFWRRGMVKVNEVVAGSGPISIPLPFVPFQLEGHKLGRVERLVVNREAPKKVSSLDVEVKLDDSLVAQGLAGCRLAANMESDSSRPGDVNVHVNRLGHRAFFFCATNDSALVEFGTVTMKPGGVTVPLLVPQSLADELRKGDWGDETDSGEALQQRAESIADRAEEVADSVAEVEAERGASFRVAQSKLGDSLRAEGKRRADSLQRALRHMADTLQHR
jgi:hypothetical protein